MLNLPAKFSLENRNILVTGATGYLGRAMVFGLAELGAKVFINGRSHGKVDGLLKEIQCAGLSAAPAVFDINDSCGMKAWFQKNSNIPLHGIVNNAYTGGAGSIETATESDYRDSYEITLVSAQRLLQYALPGLRSAVSEYGQASMVNVGSMYGIVCPDHRVYGTKKAANPPFYGAAKAALLQWTRYAACEFGHEGIRVNAISPGPFPSKNIQTSNPGFVAALAKKVPMERIGQADEIGGPLAFLISDASSFVNGANLVVDGGWTCW